MRTGSKVTKTVKTSKSFPLRIEHVRSLFEVADLRERVILSLATDLGLRISDFITIKKEVLPSLTQEPPIRFDIMTGKEEVVAHGFLSSESVELLSVYLPTLQNTENPYLFPSIGHRPISDEWVNRLLQKLVDKAQIPLNGKRLTFHCFRKMFLSAAIDSGIGLTAGKKLCGKTIPNSDDTYLTTVKLREKFRQLKKLLTIHPTPELNPGEQVIRLETAVKKLQTELVTNQTAAYVMTKRVAELETKLEAALSANERLEPLTDFMNSFTNREELNNFLDLVRSASVIRFPEHKLRLVLQKLEGREDKWALLSELFHESWEHLTEHTLDLVLKHLEEKEDHR
jgi:hypothetical protein